MDKLTINDRVDATSSATLKSTSVTGSKAIGVTSTSATGSKGIGSDNGGIASHKLKEAEGGLLDLVYEFLGFLKMIFVEIHDCMYICVPTKASAPANNPAGDGNVLSMILGKWFPDEITLYPAEHQDTMIAELQKLPAVEYQIIVAAFNQATDKKLPLDIEPKTLIKEHLEEPTTLPKDLFQNHLDLIRPYGFGQCDLERDLNRLESAVKEELRNYIVEHKGTLSEYYKDHMHQLKSILEGLA